MRSTVYVVLDTTVPIKKGQSREPLYVSLSKEDASIWMREEMASKPSTGRSLVLRKATLIIDRNMKHRD